MQAILNTKGRGSLHNMIATGGRKSQPKTAIGENRLKITPTEIAQGGKKRKLVKLKMDIRSH